MFNKNTIRDLKNRIANLEDIVFAKEEKMDGLQSVVHAQGAALTSLGASVAALKSAVKPQTIHTTITNSGIDAAKAAKVVEDMVAPKKAPAKKAPVKAPAKKAPVKKAAPKKK